MAQIRTEMLVRSVETSVKSERSCQLFIRDISEPKDKEVIRMEVLHFQARYTQVC